MSTFAIADRLRSFWQARRDVALIASSGLFDRDWYLRRNPDVQAAGLDPLMHYLHHGGYEARDPNPLFDSDWYLAQNPDVATGGLNPLAHFCHSGWTGGRDPSPFFNTRYYLTSNPDVAKESVNPLTHYLHRGIKEGRAPFDPRDLHRGVRIAVVLHLFYGDLWEEIASFLRNVPIPYDLYVSVPKESYVAWRSQILCSYPGAQVLPVRNVGRDIAPFLTFLPLVLSGNYDAVCKLHSKKGFIEPDTWRRLLLQGLLGSTHLVSRILYAFQVCPDLCLLGPRDLYVSGPALMVEDRPKVENLSQRLYPGLPLPAEWGFFAGTMFWARTDMLAKLFTAVGDGMPFEDDNTRIGGQFAHAFERIFGLMATMDRTRVGLTHLSGQSPCDATIDLVQAPGCPSSEHPSSMLRSAARETPMIVNRDEIGV